MSLQNNNNSRLFLIIVTGVLVGFPALITDSYLPSFPILAVFFNTDASFIQMSLMSTMIGIAAGQLLIGPLSDKYGRKMPLFFSFFFFILSTIYCIYTTNIYIFILLRLVQGLSCSSGMVLSRAMLTDSFSGHELAKSLSFNTAILGFTPALAPIIGGILLTFTRWQGIFIFLLLFSLVQLLLIAKLKETLPKEKRKTGPMLNTLKSFSYVIKNRDYLYYVLIFSFSMAVMFAYISSSPFIFQKHYGLSPLVYSMIFGANAVALALGALLSGNFTNQENALRIGIFSLVIMSIITAAILLSGLPFVFFEISIFVMFVFNGMIYPSSTTLALESNRKNAGTASAIHGAMSFLTGGIISPLVGLGNILYSTSIAIIACSLITLFLFIGLKKNLFEAETSIKPLINEVK